MDTKLDSIYQLEQQLMHLPQVKLPVEHQFCEGLYARTIFMPAGAVITSAIHKGECFFVVRSGEFLMTTDDGTKRLSAGALLITRAGTKRALAILTDTIVTTFHVNETNETSPEALWDKYTLPSPEEYAIPAEQLRARLIQIGSISS